MFEKTFYGFSEKIHLDFFWGKKTVPPLKFPKKLKNFLKNLEKIKKFEIF